VQSSFQKGKAGSSAGLSDRVQISGQAKAYKAGDINPD
jgi:hypothetical protein